MRTKLIAPIAVAAAILLGGSGFDPQHKNWWIDSNYSYQMGRTIRTAMAKGSAGGDISFNCAGAAKAVVVLNTSQLSAKQQQRTLSFSVDGGGWNDIVGRMAQKGVTIDDPAQAQKLFQAAAGATTLRIRVPNLFDQTLEERFDITGSRKILENLVAACQSD